MDEIRAKRRNERRAKQAPPMAADHGGGRLVRDWTDRVAAGYGAVAEGWAHSRAGARERRSRTARLADFPVKRIR